MSGYRVVCPSCGKKCEPSWACYITAYDFRRLDLPYFICGDCHLLYVDKSFVLAMVREWRNLSKTARKIPFKKIYQEALNYLQTVEEYMFKIGYRRRKFKKS